MAVDHIKILNPLSQNPWNQINTIDQSPPCAEIFSDHQLHHHFKDNNNNPSPLISSAMFPGDDDDNDDYENRNSASKKQYMHSDSFSSVNSDNLSICTEGLGIESFDYVDDLLKNDCQQLPVHEDHHKREKRILLRNRSVSASRWDESRRLRTSCVGADFPPPISSIGKCGKPFVSFKSYRQDGRFILKEIRVPELLHACRENGRLRLSLIQSDDDDDDDNAETIKDDERIKN